MNKKIIDEINKVKDLATKLKGVHASMREEARRSGEIIAKRLHDEGIIHSICDHNTVHEEAQENLSEYSHEPPKKICDTCSNEVSVKLGFYVTEQERRIINSVCETEFKTNKTLIALEAQQRKCEKEFEELQTSVKVVVAETLRKAGLIDKCEHRNTEGKSWECVKCGKHLDYYHSRGVLLSEYHDVNIFKNTLATIPINLRESSYNTNPDRWFTPQKYEGDSYY